MLTCIATYYWTEKIDLELNFKVGLTHEKQMILFLKPKKVTILKPYPHIKFKLQKDQHGTSATFKKKYSEKVILDIMQLGPHQN